MGNHDIHTLHYNRFIPSHRVLLGACPSSILYRCAYATPLYVGFSSRGTISRRMGENLSICGQSTHWIFRRSLLSPRSVTC